MGNEPVSRAEILPLLDRPKIEGAWTMSFCPSHPDGATAGRRSLGLSKDGVLKCFNGCKFADIMEALRRNAGVQREPRQEGPQEARQRPKRQHEDDGLDWRITAVHAYQDPATGKPVAEHVRLEAVDPTHPKGRRKRFTWRIDQLDPRTLREAGLLERDLPLFGAETLPEDKDEWVNILEGEKCVLAFHARQQPALCAGGGASQKDFGEALAPLKGRRVRVWPDNDPPGFAYAALLKQLLLRAGAQKVVLMPPWGEAGQDAADALAAGVTIETLLLGEPLEDHVEHLDDDHLAVHLVTELGTIEFDMDEVAVSPRALDVAMTTTWRSPLAAEPHWGHVNLLSPSGIEGRARVLAKQFPECKVNWTILLNRALSMLRAALGRADVVEETSPSDAEPAAAQWVLGGLMVEGGGTFLHGLPGSGKSQFALAAAVAVDAGLPTSYFAIPRARRALYINLERSAESMRARLARVNRVLGLPPTRSLLMIHRRGMGLVALLPAIRRAIKRYGVEVIFLDSISRAGFGKLIADEVANMATDTLNSLGCTWLAVGHQRRRDDDYSGNGGHMFGSIHFDAGADVMAALESKRAADGTLLVAVVVTKANDFSPGSPLTLAYEFDAGGLTAIRRTRGAVEDAESEELKPASVLDLCLRVLRDEGEQSADDVARIIHKQRQNVGRELSRATRDGLVTQRRDGRAVRYRLSESNANHDSELVSHHDSGPSGGDVNHESSHPPSLVEGVIHDSHSPGDGVRIRCGSCGREDMPLAGYDEEGRELCPSCLDNWKEKLG